MMARNQVWLVLLAWQSLVLIGCSTPRPPATAKSSPGQAKSQASRKAHVLSDAEAEQSIRAHAHFAAGLSYDLNEKPEEALQEYYQAALADPSYEPVVLESSRRFLRAKRTDKAIQVLTKAAALPDASGTVYAWLGLAYAQAGRNEAAVNANRTAIKKLPQSLAAYQNLAQLYLQNTKTNEALQLLDEAARQQTDDAGFLIDLSELYFRFARTQPTKSDLARERSKAVLDRAARLKPANPILLQKLGEGYLLLGDLARAEEIYAQLLKDYPEIQALRAKLAEIYFRNGQKEKAAEQLEAIAREDPTNPQTHFYIGSLAMEQKQLEKAAESFKTAILLNPEMEPAYYELTLAKLSLQKFHEAWKVLEDARARFKLNFVLEFYSGMVQSALKQYAEAIKHFVSAELLAKTGEPARLTHLFYFQFGAIYERYGDPAEAEKYFKKCLELSPNYADALNYLGYMWVERGIKLDEAKQLIEKAVELEPQNAAFLDSLGWAFFKLNNPQDALTWLLKAVEHSEEADATLYDHLGDIYSALKQVDQARGAWRKSLSVEPNEKIKSKLEEVPANARPTSP
jgi:tetratricopeptide (TPR) repeat protein